MALTELQLPTKTELYQNLRALANETRRFMERIEAASDFISRIDAGDLALMTPIPAPTGQVVVDMVDLKNLLAELVSLFAGNAVTPAKNPKEVVDKIRQMLVI